MLEHVSSVEVPIPLRQGLKQSSKPDLARTHNLRVEVPIPLRQGYILASLGKLEVGIWKLASLRSGIEFKHRFAVFNRCCAAFKDLTSFDLQSQICGF